MFDRFYFGQPYFDDAGGEANFVWEELSAECYGPSVELLAEMAGGPTAAARAWMTARPHRHIAAEFNFVPLLATAEGPRCEFTVAKAAEFALLELIAEAYALVLRLPGWNIVAKIQPGTLIFSPKRFRVAAQQPVDEDAPVIRPAVKQFRVAAQQPAEESERLTPAVKRLQGEVRAEKGDQLLPHSVSCPHPVTVQGA